MTNPIGEPLEGANEADLVEQTQEADGAGSVAPAPDVSTEEANVADAVEQGANVTTEDQDAYPRRADEASE